MIMMMIHPQNLVIQLIKDQEDEERNIKFYDLVYCFYFNKYIFQAYIYFVKYYNYVITICIFYYLNIYRNM